jgi:RimJ/RimL family protein N-acetyltransferase
MITNIYIMDKFKEVIDAYISNYSKFEKGKVEFDYDYGELIFYKDNPKTITLFGIYIYPEYRQKGLCREILHYLIEKGSEQFKCVCVQSVLSKVLYEYLERFEYKNKKFKNTRSGFVYKIT